MVEYHKLHSTIWFWLLFCRPPPLLWRDVLAAQGPHADRPSTSRRYEYGSVHRRLPGKAEVRRASCCIRFPPCPIVAILGPDTNKNKYGERTTNLLLPRICSVGCVSMQLCLLCVDTGNMVHVSTNPVAPTSIPAQPVSNAFCGHTQRYHESPQPWGILFSKYI